MMRLIKDDPNIRCAFCSKTGQPMFHNDGTDAVICRECLGSATELVKEPPKLLEGKLVCPHCGSSAMIADELCHYMQDEGGVLEPVGVELHPESRVHCGGCGTIMEGDVEYTVLHRISQIGIENAEIR